MCVIVVWEHCPTSRDPGAGSAQALPARNTAPMTASLYCCAAAMHARETMHRATARFAKPAAPVNRIRKTARWLSSAVS
jgi:hypothetical protein